MFECIRHRAWAPEVCHWLNITLVNPFTFPVPHFALWVYDSYLLLHSMLRTPVALLPAPEVLGLGMMLELAVNQNTSAFLTKYNEVCLVLF